MTANFNINKYPKTKKHVVLYFHVHQPYRLNRNFSPFDVHADMDYFGGPSGQDNLTIINRVSDLCYLPAGEMFLEMLKNTGLKISYSFTGTLLSQLAEHRPEVIELYQKLAATGKIETVCETYYHSLASFYDKHEFLRQVKMQCEKLEQLFGNRPQVFRNTELTYRNDVGEVIEQLGMKAIFTEGWDPILDWRSPNFMYQNMRMDGSAGNLKLLLKNYRRSDDIAFRFQLHDWEGYPVTAEKVSKWIADEPGYIVNLCMDYETVGEHHKADSGILEFYRHLPEELNKLGIELILPSEAVETFNAEEPLDYPEIVSWADAERDLSAWTGNEMQQKTVEAAYKIAPEVNAKATSLSEAEREKLMDTWGKLQTSDHYYYMSTKYWSDGDVHKYFSPYESPFEAHSSWLNAFNDFRNQL